MGTDTICASILIPCVNATAYNALTRWLGVTGDVQYDNNARCGTPGRSFTACQGAMQWADRHAV